MDEAKTMYGRRKLGEKVYAEQQAKKPLKSRQGTVYGKRKAPQAPVPMPAATTPARRARDENPFLLPTGARVSVPKLGELIEDPDLLDLAIETELSHPDKPRKGAIEALRDAENGRDGGPRASVTRLLDQLEKRL